MYFSYHYISAPADLESHLPVGGVGRSPQKVDSSLYGSSGLPGESLMWKTGPEWQSMWGVGSPQCQGGYSSG